MRDPAAAVGLVEVPLLVLDLSAPLAPHRVEAGVGRGARRVVGGVGAAGDRLVGFVCSAEREDDLAVSCWPRQAFARSLDQLFPATAAIAVVAAGADARRIALAVNGRLERTCGHGRRVDVARVEGAWQSLAQIDAAARFRAEQQRYRAGQTETP